jgi:hypothetical protein
MSHSSVSVGQQALLGAGLASPHIDHLDNDERTAAATNGAHTNGRSGNGAVHPHPGTKRAFRAEDDPGRSKRMVAESHQPRPAPEINSPSNTATSMASYPNGNSSNGHGGANDVGFTVRSTFNPYHAHGQQSPPHQPPSFIPGSKGFAPVPDLAQAWNRAQDSQSPPPTPLPGIKRCNKGGKGVGAGRYSAQDEAEAALYDAERGRVPAKRHGTCSRQWFQLLPVRYGWARLLLYIGLGLLFVFLLVHYALQTYNTYQNALITARMAIEHEQQHVHAAQNLAVVAGAGVGGISNDINVPLGGRPPVAALTPQMPEVQDVDLSSPDTVMAVGEEPAPAHSPAELPPISRESLAAELGKAFKDQIKNNNNAGAAAPAAPVAQAVPVAQAAPAAPVAVDPVTTTPAAAASPAEATPSPAAAAAAVAAASEAAPVSPDAPAAATPEAAPPADVAAAEPSTAQAAAAAAVSAKEDDKKKGNEDKRKADKNESASKPAKDTKEKDSKGKDKKKPAGGGGGKGKKIHVPKLTQKELKDFRAGVLSVAAPLTAAEKAVSWEAPSVPAPFLLGDDVVVVILTKSNRHELVARSVARWGAHVQNLMIFSNEADSQHGLTNVHVLGTPHPEWKALDSRYHSWRVGPMMRALRAESLTHAGQERFYLLLDDVTFPLLDQIAAKLNAFRANHAGQFPMLASGPLQLVNFYKSYWKEQQSKAYTLFKDHQLQAAPAWMTGFSARYITYLGEWIAHPDQCPTLFGDDLALAGLLACAGGMPGGGPNTDERFVFSFFELEKNAPTALADNNDLDAWRKADAYHGVNDAALIDKAYESYFGTAGIKKER